MSTKGRAQPTENHLSPLLPQRPPAQTFTISIHLLGAVFGKNPEGKWQEQEVCDSLPIHADIHHFLRVHCLSCS